ncbi:hypothetical protein Mgra_00003740 [Meloidogyne graminicola]|uniref:Uncharacterized protein n=1 Tax=Meloidogyne graminicola TaxID=189291 RepID=A0A8S9ZU42_9BILA|nr:hypothetical protein Mgra_00003740 [Meloidogyne graminicola]
MDSMEQILLDVKSGLPYLCYEDMFDVIYNININLNIKEMKCIFNQLKFNYANISYECITKYFKVNNF